MKSLSDYSECSRYRTDTSAMTIQRTWTYGRELGSLRYGSYVGSVRDYDTTYVVNYGGICLNDAGFNVGTNWGIRIMMAQSPPSIRPSVSMKS